ncbi:transaldolase [Acrasis kona]|uniref:Transaldolase n=1 Tax=Acrasis kona TaxID=1008807 RepID=A0AAW2Z418_9EUKA
MSDGGVFDFEGLGTENIYSVDIVDYFDNTQRYFDLSLIRIDERKARDFLHEYCVNGLSEDKIEKILSTWEELSLILENSGVNKLANICNLPSDHALQMKISLLKSDLEAKFIKYLDNVKNNHLERPQGQLRKFFILGLWTILTTLTPMSMSLSVSQSKLVYLQRGFKDGLSTKEQDPNEGIYCANLD